MSDQKDESREPSAEQPGDHSAAEKTRETASEAAEQARKAADGYVGHVLAVLKGPDQFFASSHRSEKAHAVIDLAGFLLIFFLAAVIARMTGYSGFDFEFGYILDGIKSALAIGIPIAGLLFALNWQAGRSGGKVSLDFYMEKFGGALVLPCLLLIVAILLDIVDIRIQSWFRGMAMVFVWIGVFATTYAYAAPGRLRTAAIFTVGFYLVYRLLILLF